MAAKAATHMIVMLCPVDASPGKEVVERIMEQYPGAYPLADDKVYLVRGGPDDVAELVARRVGLMPQSDDSEGMPTGLVIKVNGAYSGFASTSLWDWLSKEE